MFSAAERGDAALRGRRDRDAATTAAPGAGAAAASPVTAAVDLTSSAPRASAPDAGPPLPDISVMDREARDEHSADLRAEFEEFQTLQRSLPGASIAALKAFQAFQWAELPPAVETGASRGANSHQFGGGVGFEFQGAGNPPHYHRGGGHRHHNGSGQGRSRGPKRYEDEECVYFSGIIDQE